MKRVAVVGIQGVPANYGGFETLVENIIGDNCSSEISYTVFCSSRNISGEKVSVYKGARLKYISCNANGMMSVLYDSICLVKAMRGYDVILLLGISGCLFLPVFRLFCRKKLIVNIDGLEHRREKWGSFARYFLYLSEKAAVRFADVIIADNKGIQDYVLETYHENPVLIAYGGDHVLKKVTEEQEMILLNRYNLSPGQYAVSICRIEPENNCHITLEAFAKTGERLVFIGNWSRTNYGIRLREKYQQFDNITMPDSIYDLDTLYILRKNAKFYIHGHSAGGTNPSLVEAMFCGCNIIAFDVVYNRQTTENNACYFRSEQELIGLISGESPEVDNSRIMYEIASRKYIWKVIAKQYENLYY